MIGLSVSRCVLDIVQGTIDPADVTKIVSGTMAETPQDWDRVIRKYRDGLWYEFRDEATLVIRQLIADGKIEQPRLTENKRPLVTDENYWVESEDEIIWRPDGVE